MDELKQEVENFVILQQNSGAKKAPANSAGITIAEAKTQTQENISKKVTTEGPPKSGPVFFK